MLTMKRLNPRPNVRVHTFSTRVCAPRAVWRAPRPFAASSPLPFMPCPRPRFASSSSSTQPATGHPFIEAAAVPAVETQRCEGCGVELQSEHEDALGFIPASVHKRKFKIRKADTEDREGIAVLQAREKELSQELTFLRNKIRTKEEAKNASARTQAQALNVAVKRKAISLETVRKQIADFRAPEVSEFDTEAAYRHGMREVRRDRMRSLTCVRCHKLQHQGFARGTVDSIEYWKFAAMLRDQLNPEVAPDAESPAPCVVVKCVDIFDVEGSLVRDFSQLVHDRNRVVLVANKADLLPKGVGSTRAAGWLRQAAQRAGLRPHSVHILSARRPDSHEISRLHQKILQAARPDPVRAGRYLRDKAPALDVYVVGSTNVGKSTLVNTFIEKGFITRGRRVTASNHPGTTLGMVEFSLRRSAAGQKTTRIMDTPGVIDPDHLMHVLRKEELEAVTPRSRLRPVTYKVKAGQALLLGAMAMVEQTEGKPFFFTVVASPNVTVHITKRERVGAILAARAGGSNALVFPPFRRDRVRSIGLGAVPEWAELMDTAEREAKTTSAVDQYAESVPDADTEAAAGTRVVPAKAGQVQHLRFTGKGWKEGCVDIVFPGLGWVTLTGAGAVSVTVHSPPRMRVSTRDPLLPYEALTTARKFTGTPSKR